MKLAWITSAALSLGVSAAVPQFAAADNWWGRDHVRYDHRDDWRHDREFDRDISIREVPDRVMDTADRERRGRRIESVQFVRRDGREFYRFRIDDPGRHDRDMDVRVAPDGRLLSVEEAARYDRHYRR